MINGSKLLKLGLNQNRLIGPIPASLWNMTQLNWLDLNSNLLTGTISADIAYLQKLIYLDLSNNSFVGSIPEEIIMLQDLTTLKMHSNVWTGNPLEAITLYTMANLQNIDLNSCGISGTLPSDLSLMTGLQSLNLKNNSLSGSMPNSYGNFGELSSLILAENKLTSGMPPSFSKLTKLRVLQIHNNTFNCSIAIGIVSKLPVLQVIDMSHNNFLGTIPAEVFQGTAKTNLRILALASNCFYGSFPEDVCQVKSLNKLILTGLSSGPMCRKSSWQGTVFESFFDNSISHNYMEGTFPECIFSLPNLQGLYAGGNRIVGKFPPTITSTALEVLSMPYNSFYGTFPAYFATSKNLTSIDMGHNRLSGNISDFGNSHIHRKKLHLSINNFSGKIPDTLLGAQAKKVDYLDILDGNVFTCGSAGLPANDPHVDSYQCGSGSLNRSLEYYAIALLVAGCGLWFISTYSKIWGEFALWLAVARGQKKHMQQQEKFENTAHIPLLLPPLPHALGLFEDQCIVEFGPRHVFSAFWKPFAALARHLHVGDLGRIPHGPRALCVLARCWCRLHHHGDIYDGS